MAITEIGQLRSTATLQKNIPINNVSGGQKDAWFNVCTFRCNIKQKRSQRTIEQMQPTNDQDYELICRSQVKLIDNLSYDARIVFNGRNYVIKSYNPKEINKRQWYILTICSHA